jgi:glycosyltransferase involved in cell wall biosynthesis
MQNDKSKIKKDHPKISIVIPSYNKGKYLKQTLQSIVNQDYPYLEVIVQDGGSTDGSVEIIKNITKRYNFIKWESRKDKGQVDAINKGLNKAKGDILTFINADDVYDKDALKWVAKAYIDNPEALWFAGKGKVIDKSGNEIAKLVTFYKNFLLKINSYTLLLSVNYLMQPSVFFTWKAFKKYRPIYGINGIVIEYDFYLNIGEDQMPVLIDACLSKFRLLSSGSSVKDSTTIMSEDFKITLRHTKNPALLSLHLFNNFVRKLLSKIY